MKKGDVNPFVYGTVVTGKNFADREDEVDTLLDDVTSGQNVILFSPRRYGKSSLIKATIEKLSSDYIVIECDMMGATNKERFIKLYSDAIFRSSSSKLDEIVEFFKDVLRLPSISIGMEDTPHIEINLKLTDRDLGATLLELFKVPQNLAEKKGKKVVVILDEFQEIENIDGDQLQRDMRTIIQHHEDVSYVFMGSKKHLLDEIFNSKQRAMYRIGKMFPLGKIESENFVPFIANHFRRTGVKIDRKLAEKIVDITDGHPENTQQLCHVIWGLSVGKGQVDEEDIIEGRERVINSQSSAYTAVWNGLRASQRTFLIALASEKPKNVFSRDFIERWGLEYPSKVQTSVRALLKKDLIETLDNDRYGVQDVFFAEWLKTFG